MKPLATRTLVFYALPNLASSVATLPLALFVPSFYADDLGLPLAAVGAAIAASRILDVVTDPLVGQLSDRTRSRFGRRKPFIAAGAPLLLLAIWQLFVPGERGSVGVAHLAAWTALLFLGFTIVDLPYKAWGAELSTDYSERSRVAAWREGAGFVGQILLLLLLLVLGLQGIEKAPNQLHAIAVALGVLLATLVPSLLGFDPGRAAPSADAKAALLAVYGLLPGLLMAAGAPFLWNFPITREVQRRLRAQIGERPSF